MKRENERLTIAMVIDTYDMPNAGGVLSAQRFTEYHRENHRIIIVSTGEPKPDKYVVPEFHVPFVRKLMEKMKFTFAWPSRQVLEEAFSQADLVHVQLPFYLGMKAIQVANEMNVPVISSFHVQPENICYNIGIRSARLIDLLYRFFVRFVYNRSLAVICPSAFARKELERYGLRVPAFVVSNGVLPRFRPAEFGRPEELKDKFIILTVGRLARDKRHDVLIQAIARSKYAERIQFIAAGQGPQKESIEEMGRILPVKPMVGYVSDEDLLRYLNIADLYVHPSEVELESMSVLEAMACGRPVLISDAVTSAARQFALNDEFLFRMNDPAHLSSRIDRWIEDTEGRLAAGREYLERSRNYRIEESVRKIENLYVKYAGYSNQAEVSGKLLERQVSESY